MGTDNERWPERHRSHWRIRGRAPALTIGLLLASAALPLIAAPMTSTIALPKTADTGSFARYVPFADGREVIVRRGRERGFRYGLALSRRKVTLGDGAFEVVTYQALLSPPPLLPGHQPLSAAAARRYGPVIEVLFLPDAEVLIPRAPDGFTDAEVGKILDAVSVR